MTDDDLCPRCGWVLGAASAACPSCGEALVRKTNGFDTVFFPETAGAGPEAVSESAGLDGTTLLGLGGGNDGSAPQLKRKPLLTCRGGARNGQRLEVSCPRTTVGRQGGEISIEDRTLSGRHFMIEERGHEFFLRDLGSTNGTFLNGHLVRSAPLKSGDEIRAGESVFVFSVLDVIPCD